ncbi:vascular-related unknown protein 4-like [Tasmannia lanceolata]|uniref:vascular-related unknown protein 4-like n=1 Tax=Tasmannia lanceolata TaxID=3420 RepID=UPI0040633556
MDFSTNTALSPQEEKVSSEESGWTMYFDDFLTTDKDEPSACSSDYKGSSLVSDAASCVALKPSNHVNSLMGQAKICKKLSFKKRRTKGGLEEDPLEDTASSPASSPKVSDSRRLDMNPSQKDDNRDSSQEKEITAGGCSEGDKRNELGFLDKGNNCTELKQRGLCLVPISMLVNYLG